ncbi:MAG TPA: hypothetical protein VKV28_03800, partial [Candidatus Binataceae bacterium]|nr:hypothetical protein [Candidatus Binataceae bacterium]
MAVVPKFVGARVKRREDPRLIAGAATYCDDVRLPEMAVAVIMRSPYAHARILSIDLSAARNAPGVICALSGEDLKGRIGPLPCVAPVPKLPDHPVLARGKVRFVGEAVAVVVADNAYHAQDVLDLIEVQYEPLDAVTDPEAALAKNAPLLHEELGSNLVSASQVPGRVDAPMREADA